MKTLGFLNPKARAGQSRLVFNLGWVLADGGFRVGLVDFDPQAGLTELAGASSKAGGSIYDVLAPLFELARAPEAPEAPEPVELAPNLSLIRGDIRASIFDDAPRAAALVQGIRQLLEAFAKRDDLHVVLCDLGASLGPFSRTLCATIDAIIVPLAPAAVEDAALQSLASALRRWREAAAQHGPTPSEALGFVFVRPSGASEVELERVAAAYHRELPGEHIGTIKEFPSLASMARRANKPEIELTMADGAMGSLAVAVVDLRRQYETLATQVVRASDLLDEDTLVDALERALLSAMEDLSSHPVVDSVSGVEIEATTIRPGGLRVVGSASVAMTRDHFPLRFDVELDRSHESVMQVHRLDVDGSSPTPSPTSSR